MDSKCNQCGSTNMTFHRGFIGDMYEPPYDDYWECNECGHVQSAKKDYDYYKEDFE